MPDKTVAAFGTWKSPITTDLLTRGSVGLGQIVADGENVYWTEMRPSEAGRNALVMERPDGEKKELVPPPFNVRSRVHEYGGGAFTVCDDVVWFIDAKDQTVFRLAPGNAPEKIAKKSGTAFADFIVDKARNRLICVAEDVSGGGEAVNSIVAIGFDGAIDTLVSGADFYAAPKLSPDGKRLAWIEWFHPNMPWDGTQLREATVSDSGALIENRPIAGGEEESVFQPEYAPDGVLHYVSDRSGFWNIYRHGDVTHYYEFDAEFGLPHWIFGMRTYGFLADGRIVCTYAEQGDWSLGIVDPAAGDLRPLDLPWCTYDSLICAGGRAWFHGGRVDSADEIVELDLDALEAKVLRRSVELDVPQESISVAQSIEFPTTDGRTAFGYYYPPANAAYVAPEGELPPLIVKSHGGPTGQSTKSLSLKFQYWTSRGFAVMDVNYSGSTGFGRDYRERLAGQWGISDVDDCANAARYAVEKGLADPDRLIIVGGSAGGYTTLAALAFRDVFKAGCSSYGVGDLTALTNDTHKFESRYLDKLVGRWPEDAKIYRERSPIQHTEHLNCPILFLQGDEDKVVPPNQAEAMVDALRKKSMPVAYLLFEGEGHGFRRADTIKRAMEAELSFYAQIFGFEPADSLEAVEIENL